MPVTFCDGIHSHALPTYDAMNKEQKPNVAASVDRTTSHDTPKPVHPADQSTVAHLGETKDHARGPAALAADIPNIDGYVVESEIARGGMGRVLTGREVKLDREVAIKVLLANDGSGSSRFVAESRFTAKLPHPGIPPVYALGQLDDGSPFLAMKLVRGENLEKLLEQRTSTAHEFSRWIAVFEQICQAVGYAHSQNIIHRDIKPANVMVGAFGEVYVMDWGLAKDLRNAGSTSAKPSSSIEFDEQAEATLVGTIMGTPTYMPPEQARGEAVDARADVFSLGGILCAILAGRPPFAGKSSREILEKAAAADIEATYASLDSCNSDPELVALAKTCMSPHPDERPTDARALAELIAAYRAGVDDRLRQAESERAAAEVRAREQKKRRQLALGAGTLTMLVLIAGIIGTSVGMYRANDSLNKLTTEQSKTAAALADATTQKQQTQAALEKLTQSRSRNVDNLRTVTEQLVEDRLGRESQLSQADRLFINGLLPMWEEIAAARGATAEGQMLQAEGYYRVGRLQEWLGQREDAEAQLRSALTLHQAVANENPDRPEYRQELARTHNSLAILLRDTGKMAEAEENYLAAISILLELNEEFPKNLNYKQDLAGWYNNLSRLMSRIGERDKALAYMRQSLDQRKELAAKYPEHSEYRRDVAESHNNLGIVFIQFRDFAGAQGEFDQALSIRQKLVKEFPKNTEFRLLLANTFNNLGVLAYNMGDLVKAEERLRAAAAEKLRLAEDYPSVPKYRQDLSTTYVNLSGILLASQKPGGAVESNRQAIHHTKLLVAEYPDMPDHRRDLGSAYNNLGSLHHSLKDYREAERYLREALDIKNALATEFPDVAYYREDVAPTLFNLAVTFGQQHASSPDGERDFAKEALDMLRQSVNAGWSDVEQLATHPDLASIKDTEEFQGLLAELRSNVEAAKTDD